MEEAVWINDGETSPWGGKWVEVTDENRYIVEITETRFGHRARFPYWRLPMTFSSDGGFVEKWKFGRRERIERWARREVELEKAWRARPMPEVERRNLGASV